MRGSRALRKIELDHHAVGIGKKNLLHAGAGWIPLLEFDTAAGDVRAHGSEIPANEGDVIKIAGMRAVRAGADGATVGHQMHHGLVAAIEPVTRKGEGRTPAGTEAKHALIEIL